MNAKEFTAACTDAALNGHCARQSQCGSCHHRNFKSDFEQHSYCNEFQRQGYCPNQPCDWSVLVADGDEDCPIYQAYMVGKFQDVRLRTEYKVLTGKPFRIDWEQPHPLTLEREYKKNGLHEAEHWEYLNSLKDSFGFE